MGLVKSQLDDSFGSRDTNVCSACVSDDVLATLVAENVSSKLCDYCNQRSRSKIAAPFDVIMQRIFDSICEIYGDANELGVPWDGGWIVEPYDSSELLGEFDPGWPDKFRCDVEDSLGDQYGWVPHSGGDWSAANPDDVLMYCWQSFKSLVTTRVRYLFQDEPHDEMQEDRPDYLPISEFFRNLGSIVLRLKLAKEIPSGTKLYRCRKAKTDEIYTSFDDLGMPPKYTNPAGRMNPAGIPYFYLSLDKNTALQEVTDVESDDYYEATFQVKRSFYILGGFKFEVQHPFDLLPHA